MEEYAGNDEFEAVLDRMLSQLVDDGIMSMTWNEIDGGCYALQDGG